MSKGLKAPKTQKRLTNIVVVKLKQGGKRFEIACYPNKIEEWRRGVETDIDEVLQRPVVFTNVSKGELAKAEDLKKAFNTTDQIKACKVLLEKGELQVSEKERKQELDQIFKDIATLVVEKCVNRETGQALTVGVVERAMKEIHVSVNPAKSAKQQALQVIKLLEEKSNLPLERAKMKLQIILPEAKYNAIAETLKPLLQQIDSQKTNDGTVTIDSLILPKDFRQIDQVVKESEGKTEVLLHAVKPETDAQFD
eukprot:TRINITY_DN4429_c0_g1_i1.p1 TRINITY_DN4429_c0_g1~~TRINITY_DN4429_c0_g1_i1.p1  ORF type:complete len:261 (+),score=68.24 TRINITY_DN4429_c0_g1_i1:27-785(+)